MKNSIKLTIDLSSPDRQSITRAISLLESIIPDKAIPVPIEAVKADKKEPAKKEPKAKATPKSEGPSIDGVREALALKVENHRDSIRAKLTELGAKNVTTLDPDKYGEFMDYLNGLK
jgi:hypothetical protein